MKKRTQRFRTGRYLLNLALIAVLIAQSVTIFNPVTSRASSRPSGGMQRFIVRYKGKSVAPQRGLTLQTQQQQLDDRSSWLTGQLSNASGYIRVTNRLSHLPFVIVEADAAGEQSLRANPNIVSIFKDKSMKSSATNFVAIPDDIGGTADEGFSDGTNDFTGEGYAVAVIDSGVHSSLPQFTDKIVSEACYSHTADYPDAVVTSVCPGGATSSTAEGAAEAGVCTDVNDLGCWHGTAVSATAVGLPEAKTIASEAVDLSGVAKGAQLIAIRNRVNVQEIAGQEDWCDDEEDEEQSCEISYVSGILEGLNRVVALASDPSFTTPIAAVNISQVLTSEPVQSNQETCDQLEFSTSINLVSETLLQHNIAVVAAAGNDGEISGNEDGIYSPACATNVVAVGASTKNGHMTSYSNAGELLDIVSLGGELDGDHEDGGIAVPTSITSQSWLGATGTSFAAPQVAGAYAVMREKNPTLSTQTILQLLQESGAEITEDRAEYTEITHKELDLATALAASDDMPNITTFSGPSGSVAAGSTISLTVEAENATHCVVGTNGTAGSPFALTSGSATTSVTVPTDGNSVSYLTACYDDEAADYAAQSLITFAIAGGNTNEPPSQTPSGPQTPGGPGGAGGISDDAAVADDQWVPGTPQSGVTAAQRIQAVVIASCCLAMLLLFNKSQLIRTR